MPLLLRCLLVLSGLAVLVHGALAQAVAGHRVALVIGNSAYTEAPLVNPLNDAKAMSRLLSGKGFTVIEALDASKPQIEAAIRRTQQALQGKGGIGVFYYAGHAMQLDWRNYILPVEAAPADPSQATSQSVDIEVVLNAFRAAGNQVNIVILDACRDNPFAAKTSGRGLAQMDAPPGTLLAYATAPGSVAEDGRTSAGNGLYTQFLLQELATPGAKVEDIFKRVRLQVRRSSQGRQIPWESTSLEDDFYFDTGSRAIRADAIARAEAFEREKAEWDRIKESNDPADLYAYLQRYPNGLIAELAQVRLEQVERRRTSAATTASETRERAFLARFRNGDRYDFIVRDGATGRELRRATSTIRALGDDVFESVTSGIPSAKGTRAGFILEDGGGSYDPPWPIVPGGDFQVGKRWTARSVRTSRDGKRQWVDIDVHVAAREVIEVPLGKFETYRVDVVTRQENGQVGTLQNWFNPDWAYSVRQLFTSESASGRVSSTLRELTGMRRAD